MSRRHAPRAIGLTLLAELAGVALLAAAGGLIGWSAQRPSWAAIGGLLAAVELLAFLRAPLRHAGQLAAHDLTTAELSAWRHRLVLGLGAGVQRLGAPVASGDALERLIADAQLAAERTQRVALPRLQASTGAVLVVGVAAAASPRAAALLATGAASVLLVLRGFAPRLASAEAALANARRELAATSVEVVEAKVELTLLGAADYLEGRAEAAVRHRAEAAAGQRRARTMATAAATLLAAGSAYAAAAVLGSHPGVAAVGALVVAVGALEVAGLATSAALVDPAAAAAAAAVAELPEATPGRAAEAEDPTRPALVARGLGVEGLDGELLLAPCDLEVHLGELVAIVGPSGAGKSTLLAALSGIAPVASGSSEAAGVVLQGLDDVDRARLVAYVGHEDGILPGSVREALTMGRRDLGDDQLLAALGHVGLAETLIPRGGLDLELEAAGANLSTGERRRLAVARALATEAKVWLLDEPAAGLDPEAADQLGEVIAKLGASRAVVVVTHRDDDAQRASRVLAVRNGVLAASR